jgi:hypothetical protein
MPIELVPEFVVSLPTCRSGGGAERCAALVPALGAGFAGLYRPYPYFAFGAALTYSRAGHTRVDGALDAEHVELAARGRVYLYEEGAFDPYLELDLGYGSLRTSFVTVGGARYEDAAFGSTARIGGGLDFFVLPSLELGVAASFMHLLAPRGERCVADRCTAGNAPEGAMVGALALGVRATLLLGEPL